MTSLNSYLITLSLEQTGIIIFMISLARSQQMMLPVDCNQASSRFLEICRQFRQFDGAPRRVQSFVAPQSQLIINAPAVPHNHQLSSAIARQPSFVSSVYDCLDLQCLCPYFRGALSPNGECHLWNGQILQRAIRKEIRMLNNSERERFLKAIRQLKASGEYNRLADIHRQEASESGAHSGPSFLLWHREFIKRMEIALRLIDPLVALPYWDSSLDQHLSDPRNSIMWSSFLMGESNLNGQVINGPFAGFTTLEGHSTITRHLGQEGHLLTDQNINMVYDKACPYPPNFSALEYYHASVHIWVGGDMKPPLTSANDPVFFLHHSFVDYIFENWRRMHQNRMERERDYPEEIISCTSSLHFANAKMRPFNLVNRQGLSNAYTDYLYTYAPRPNCNHSQPTCHSQFLFCDLRNGPAHCVSKIKLGKGCEQFVGEDACYMGVCLDGYCRPKSITSVASIGTFRVPTCDCKVNAIKGGNGWPKIAKPVVAGVTYQLMIYVAEQL
ncbi:tyrosinase 1 [Loa loa]|uniref:Tyrosinase 1 n=1 Tax=Loa loa TaxID=7209 RepID=A0A1S0U3A8_LOALO|nr:tyrosinase 1 [Loa loa]EFO24472.2 tyrosinase 1 [Loa loa]